MMTVEPVTAKERALLESLIAEAVRDGELVAYERGRADENEACVPRLLAIRDALIERDIDEAYHLLRMMADPVAELGRSHWAKWERIRDRLASEDQTNG